METRISLTNVALCAVLALGAFAGRASAQNADAEALFTEADQLEKAGKINDACDAFDASNRIEPRAGTLIRLGACRESQGRLASAWSAYKDALTRVKDAKKREIAEAKIKALEPRLSYLTVLVPDESRVDGLTLTRNGVALDPALWNRGAPVDGGTYTIAGKAPGHEEWRTTVEVAGEAAKASVEVPKFKVLRALAVPLAATPPAKGNANEEAVHDTRSPGLFTTKRKIAVVVTGLGLAAAVVGAVEGLQSKHLKDQAFALCPDPATPCADASEAQAKLDSGRSRALTANIAFGVAGAAVLGGAVLWFIGAPSHEAVTVAGARVGGGIGLGTASLDLTWSFQ